MNPKCIFVMGTWWDSNPSVSFNAWRMQAIFLHVFIGTTKDYI